MAQGSHASSQRRAHALKRVLIRPSHCRKESGRRNGGSTRCRWLVGARTNRQARCNSLPTCLIARPAQEPVAEGVRVDSSQQRGAAICRLRRGIDWRADARRAVAGSHSAELPWALGGFNPPPPPTLPIRNAPARSCPKLPVFPWGWEGPRRLTITGVSKHLRPITAQADESKRLCEAGCKLRGKTVRCEWANQGFGSRGVLDCGRSIGLSRRPGPSGPSRFDLP